MLPASKQFSEAVVTDTRRVLGRVIVDYTDPFMDQGISISASEQINPATMLPQVADNILTPARRWASCDGSTLVDGNSFPAPAVAADGQMGWWGSQLSDTGSMFIATFPTVTLTFISRPIHSLRVVGDSARGEFPVDFEIRLLGVGSVVRHTQIVTGNALVDWQVNIIPVTEVTQYVVEVRRWSHAGRQAKVLEAFTSVQETYEGDDIIGISLLEERELAQQSLPVGNVSANEITLRLDNSTRKFDAGNRQSSLYQLLVQNRRIRAWLGVLPERTVTETTQAEWALGTLSGVRATPVGDLVLDEAARTSFTRGSTAHQQNGTLVNTNLPRFEPGKFGQAVMVEDGTTNLLNAVSSKAEANMLSNNSAFATLVYVSNFGRSDNTSAVVTQIAAGGASMGFYFTAAGFAPVIAGLVYTASCYVYTNHIGRSYTIHAGWLRADNSTIASPSATFSLTAGEWTRLVITGTAPVDAVNLRITVVGIGAAAVGEQYWFDDICVEQKPYATSWQIGGTPRAEEIISAPLANVVLPAQGTIEFWWNPQIPFSAITNQQTSPMLLQIGNYHSNASLILWAFFATPGTEPWLMLFVRGQTASGWSISPWVRASGSGWYQQGVWNHYTVTWSAGNNFRVYRNGVLVGGPYVIADPVTSWAGTQVWFANNDVGQGMPGALIDDIRISSTERTAAEILAGFNSAAPLPVDANTTYLLRGDGSLLNAVHLPSGTRISPPIDLSFLTDTVSATASWGATVPTETMLDVETSLDNGATWHPIANGGNIAGIAGGQNMSGVSLLARQVLTTQNAGLTPQLQDLTIMQVNREYVPLGTFWSGEWHATSEKVYVSTTGRDRLELLRKSTYAMSQVAVNQSLHALATAVLTDAGLAASELWIDPALHSIIVPNAWFGTLSHREALRQIAEASLGQVYADRNGVVRVESVGHLLGQESFVNPLMTSTQSLTITADNYFRKDTPIKWGELANRVEVETQPLRAVATTQEVFRSNEPVAIAAGQTVVLTVRYNEPPVIEAVASLSGAPAGAAITAATYFAWGATVTVTNGTNAGTFTLLINGKLLTILNRERATAEDLVSIRDNGLLRYEYPANHLVQTLARAQTIADTLLRLYRHPRRDLTMDWRGNPALTLGDMIITRDHQDWLRYWVTKQEIDYDGALRARLEGRLAR